MRDRAISESPTRGFGNPRSVTFDGPTSPEQGSLSAERGPSQGSQKARALNRAPVRYGDYTFAEIADRLFQSRTGSGVPASRPPFVSGSKRMVRDSGYRYKWEETYLYQHYLASRAALPPSSSSRSNSRSMSHSLAQAPAPEPARQAPAPPGLGSFQSFGPPRPPPGLGSSFGPGATYMSSSTSSSGPIYGGPSGKAFG